MQICIFEDDNISNFYPLSLSRPIYELVCGMDTLKEKISRSFPKKKISLHCRSYLKELVAQENPKTDVNIINDDKCFFINGRILFNKETTKKLSDKFSKDKVFLNGKDVIAAYLTGKNLESFKKKLPELFSKSKFKNISSEQVDINLINYTWDLINYNNQELNNDFRYYKNKARNKKINLKTPQGAHFLNKKNIIIGKNVSIKPGVVLDATEGTIYISSNVKIHPNVVIEGPVFLGENVTINSNSYIYDNVSIGKYCKIGGEVEDSIFLPYSNKQHAGFIGHSYIGGWVNLGADTNSSDLKNNYRNVKVIVNGKLVDSKTKFLGTIMGDHSKTSINTMLNSGTVIGFSSNIFGSGFPEKFIPSFIWGGFKNSKIYKLEKSMETASVVYLRRNITFTEIDKKIFKKIFDLTKNERLKEK